jgi:hypothetical protein
MRSRILAFLISCSLDLATSASKPLLRIFNISVPSILSDCSTSNTPGRNAVSLRSTDRYKYVMLLTFTVKSEGEVAHLQPTTVTHVVGLHSRIHH